MFSAFKKLTTKENGTNGNNKTGTQHVQHMSSNLQKKFAKVWNEHSSINVSFFTNHLILGL